MQKLNQKLKTKYRLYHNWHQHKHHNKIHWGVFIIFSFFISALMLNPLELNLQKDNDNFLSSIVVKKNVNAQSGAIINAASCQQADVQAAVDNAVNGDVVAIPAGRCLWNKTLTITKGVVLSGAGADNTILVSEIAPASPGNVFNEGNYLIVYSPTRAHTQFLWSNKVN